ncbi:uncharacterized protein ACNLHF_008567 [Anomaloglossus baeobatrachus]|uniref:uncharacterized protein LOC142290672 n=1 Tax=Anomaloglossus baeobatrachus TaxID=238106 RepID=UPI003F50270E
MSSVLSFNVEQTASILAKVTARTQFLTIPSEEVRSRDYLRELKRNAALELHSVTLAEYHRAQRIPRGLRVSLRPTLFSENPDYCKSFEAILNKCSFDIILLTIDYLQKELDTVDTNIKGIEDQLAQTLNATALEELKTKYSTTVTEFSASLQIRKRDKFLRDQEDYNKKRVYKWQASFPSRNYRHTGSFSAGSDSDLSTSGHLPFLGQKRTKRDRRGGADTGPRRQNRVTTRSQIPLNAECDALHLPSTLTVVPVTRIPLRLYYKQLP